MPCQHPDCPNLAQPGLPVPLCGVHASQLVFGFTLPPYQVLVLGQGLEQVADLTEQATQPPGGDDPDLPAEQPPAAQEDLFGDGPDQPWEASWDENGNGDSSYA